MPENRIKRAGIISVALIIAVIYTLAIILCTVIIRKDDPLLSGGTPSSTYIDTSSVDGFTSSNITSSYDNVTSSVISSISTDTSSEDKGSSNAYSSDVLNNVSSAASNTSSNSQTSSSVTSTTSSSLISSVTSSHVTSSNNSIQPQKSFTSGIWYSFEDLNFKTLDYKGFKSKVDKMFDDAVSLGADAVICQVRPFADALYYSDYFPLSEILTGKQGKDPGYDALDYMVSAAHSRGLQMHAWLNPYRVTLWSADHTLLADDNPAKIWLTDDDPNNDRNVLKYNNRLYFNPAVKEVQTLVLNGVREIVNNYEVDGIHIDDYFYPSDPHVADGFDKPEYDNYVSKGGNLPLDDWRRNNINVLVSGIYRAVKTIDNSVVFGVSPSYHISNNGTDDNYKFKYADIKKWMTASGYIDYIAPQLYFGYQYPNDEIKYDYLLNLWTSLSRLPRVKIYIGLAAYKINDATADLSSGEWITENDILARQTTDAKKYNCDGVFIFSYSGLFNDDPLNAEQRNNLSTVLKK